MTNYQQFKYALGMWPKAWSFIFKNKLSHFFLYPFLAAITIYLGATKLIDLLIDKLMAYVHFLIGAPMGDAFDSWESFFLHLASNVVQFIAWICGLYVFWKISKYVTLIIMSPVMSVLSSRTEEIITGKSLPFDFGQLMKDIVRGSALSLRNLFLELSITMAIMFANVIVALVFAPLDFIVTPVSLIASFLVGAYFSGFSNLDYPLENRRYSFQGSIRFMRANKGLAVGNGLIYSLLVKVPILGVTLATVTTTVAATMIVCDEKNKIN
jgi:CysZ protein